MTRIKVLATVFFFALILNIIWENIHSLLYEHYKGEQITEIILLRASLNDAIFITISALIFFSMLNRKLAIYLSCFSLLLLSIFIEKWALGSARWAYKDIMPIVPFLNTGLTPTVQLAVLGFLSFLAPRFLLKNGIIS